ncbi:Glutamine synthetase 1, mitochondrial, partial [Geodia barretti]
VVGFVCLSVTLNLTSRVSVRLTEDTTYLTGNEAGRGYLEDRRPSSNGDPYLVCEALVRTAVLDDWTDFDWTNMPSKP